MVLKEFYISIYVLVPTIFGLLSVFSFVLSYQLSTSRLSSMGLSVLVGSGGFLFIFAAAIGFLIIRVVLKPSERLIKKAKGSPLLHAKHEGAIQREPFTDQMEEFATIFDRVAQVLDDMDVESLFPNVVGKSRAMRQVFSQAVKVAQTDATVLILGDSGTGKELIAESIVLQGKRKEGPFIKVNCAAISSELMESELFGHERGAFTGAISRKLGCFELADGGTLFLDEIGDMPLNLQVKLLRVLQEQEFFRVGGKETVRVDVRIITATNKSLEKMIAECLFREDLFYRINVFPIRLPALRNRIEDIPYLAVHFLDEKGAGKSFDPATMKLLMAYSWPGNVRELENIVARAAVMAGESPVIEPVHLSASLQSLEVQVQSIAAGSKLNGAKNLDETLNEIEKGMICEALRKTRGVQVRAAEMLGINQRSLWNRVKKYQIDVAVFKSEHGKIPDLQ